MRCNYSLSRIGKEVGWNDILPGESFHDKNKRYPIWKREGEDCWLIHGFSIKERRLVEKDSWKLRSTSVNRFIIC